MNFEVNDVTARILKEFQDTIDDALGDIKDKQDENMELLKCIQDKVKDFDVQKDLKPLNEGIFKYCFTLMSLPLLNKTIIKN